MAAIAQTVIDRTSTKRGICAAQRNYPQPGSNPCLASVRLRKKVSQNGLRAAMRALSFKPEHG
jgi:hypothetical protein